MRVWEEVREDEVGGSGEIEAEGGARVGKRREGQGQRNRATEGGLKKERGDVGGMRDLGEKKGKGQGRRHCRGGRVWGNQGNAGLASDLPFSHRMAQWLGAAYHSLGRTTAASKSFSRSLELSPGRLYARVALGSVQLDLGNLGAAEEQLSAAAPSEHPVALIGLALCALRRCASDVFAGSPGTSALSLRLATSHAASAARLCPTSVAAWQTLGDCHLMHHRATPVEHRGEGGEAEGWGLRAEKQREARRAYARALHLRPGLAGLWGAAAASLHHEAALREAHVALGPGEAPALRKQARSPSPLSPLPLSPSALPPTLLSLPFPVHASSSSTSMASLSPSPPLTSPSPRPPLVPLLSALPVPLASGICRFIPWLPFLLAALRQLSIQAGGAPAKGGPAHQPR